MRARYRAHLNRAILEAGYATREAFGRAIGFSGRAVSNWIECRASPSRRAREAIAEALDPSPGADCEGVLESDIDWLLEEVDELSYIESVLRRCDG